MAAYFKFRYWFYQFCVLDCDLDRFGIRTKTLFMEIYIKHFRWNNLDKINQVFQWCIEYPSINQVHAVYPWTTWTVSWEKVPKHRAVCDLWNALEQPLKSLKAVALRLHEASSVQYVCKLGYIDMPCNISYITQKKKKSGFDLNLNTASKQR